MKNSKVKKISIIIATYNAARTLQRCLDSIRLQKNENVELIVIDGCSTDRTMDIVQFNKDIIDYFVHEKDEGIYDAWNKGIKMSSGEWILFLGADDMLLSNTIDIYTELVTTVKSKHTDFISAYVKYIDSSGAFWGKYGSAWDWKKFSKSMNVAHVASLHSRYLFKEVGFFDASFKICADYELLLRKQEHLRTLFVNEPVALMTIGGVSLSIKAIKETCEIINTYIGRNILNRNLLALSKYILYYQFLIRFKIWRLFRNEKTTVYLVSSKR